MFSLIITIISIALVAAIAAATIYYGGSSLTENGSKAAVSKYRNEASQIAGAARMYEIEQRQAPQTVADLEGEYLKTIPAGDWAFGNNVIVRTGIEPNECVYANEEAGFDYSDSVAFPTAVNGIPSCDDVINGTNGISKLSACCETPSS